jgi:ABC-type Mn2+/Zn2+ transport system permease subunit
MRRVIIVSPIIGVTTNLLGLVASLYLDIPVGSSIVLVSTTVFAFSVLVSPKRRRRMME